MIIRYSVSLLSVNVLSFAAQFGGTSKEKVEAALGRNVWETGIKSEERQVANVNKLPQKQGPSLE